MGFFQVCFLNVHVINYSKLLLFENIFPNSYLVKCGVVDTLISSLSEKDEMFLSVTLDAIKNLFRYPDVVKTHFEKCGGVDKLKQLQKHSSVKIYNRIAEFVAELKK
jgi:hypothetical protein